MLPDSELVKRCIHGEPTAQKQFYDRFAPRMLGVCYRYVQNIHEAEDMLQEGFIRAFRHLEDFRGDGSLDGWVRRIMVTTTLNFLKNQKRIRKEMEITKADYEPADPADAIDMIENNEVIELIKELSPGYRTVLNLFAIEGYSHQEIGAMLGIGESTSRSQYLRARKLLMKLITERSKIRTTHERAGIK